MNRFLLKSHMYSTSALCDTKKTLDYKILDEHKDYNYPLKVIVVGYLEHDEVPM